METKSTNYNETLLISVGATPQVVTETLWYYTYNQIREFDKIILLTTSEGKKTIDEELFIKGRIRELELAISKPHGHFKISNDSIITLRDDKGNELDDIRTSKDSEHMANHVFKVLKGLTEDQNGRMTIVIAGGRKSMPAILASAVSFYGRQQDEMVHVLVNDDLFWTDWFFPNDSDDPKQKIEVSQLPFLRLKNYTTGINSERPLDLLSIAQSRLDNLAPLANVIIDKNNIIAEGVTIKLPPAEMQIWRYMAKKKKEQCLNEDLACNGSCGKCFATHTELVDEFDGKIADEYFQIVKNGSQLWDNRKEMGRNILFNRNSFIFFRCRKCKSR